MGCLVFFPNHRVSSSRPLCSSLQGLGQRYRLPSTRLLGREAQRRKPGGLAFRSCCISSENVWFSPFAQSPPFAPSFAPSFAARNLWDPTVCTCRVSRPVEKIRPPTRCRRGEGSTRFAAGCYLFRRLHGEDLGRGQRKVQTHSDRSHTAWNSAAGVHVVE